MTRIWLFKLFLFADYVIDFLTQKIWPIRKLKENIRESEIAAEATFAWYDMNDKFFKELLDNPSITEDEWHEWLKICKFADEFFEKTHPQITPHASLADMVRRKLANPWI